MRKGWLALVLMAVTVAACASGGERTARSGSRDVLTAEEIAAQGAAIQNAYQAVEQLRPHFFRVRSNPTMGVGAARVEPIVVYVNGVRRGGVNELNRILVGELESIRYVRPTDAQTRYGMGHGSGALEVTIKRAQ